MGRRILASTVDWLALGEVNDFIRRGVLLSIVRTAFNQNAGLDLQATPANCHRDNRTKAPRGEIIKLEHGKLMTS